MITEAQKQTLAGAHVMTDAEWNARRFTVSAAVVPRSASAIMARVFGWLSLILGSLGGLVIAAFDPGTGFVAIVSSVVSAVGLFALAEIIQRLRVIAWKVWADAPAERDRLF